MDLDALRELAAAVLAARAGATEVEAHRRLLSARLASPPDIGEDVRGDVEAWTDELRRHAAACATANQEREALLGAVREAHGRARVVVQGLMDRGVPVDVLGTWASVVRSDVDPVGGLDTSTVAGLVERVGELLAAPVTGPGRGAVRAWAVQDVAAWEEARRWGNEQLAAVQARGALLEPGHVGERETHERARRLPRLVAQPFGYRVDTDVEGPNGRWKRRLYLALHGEPVTNLGGDPQVHVISFTAPLARLRHAQFGDIEEISVRETLEYQVTLKGEFGPNLTTGRYLWAGGAAEVGSLRDAAGVDVPDARIEEEQARQFGLQQIVFRTDAVQDSAMRLPIRGHVLITGSPGSGKTTIAVQRVVFAIREHRRELELDEKDPPVFTEQTTKVFVRSRVLVPYLEVLLKQLEVPFVEVLALDDWRLSRLRELGVIQVGERRGVQFRSDADPDSVALGWAKTRREVLGALRRHAADVWLRGVDTLEERMLTALDGSSMASRVREDAARRIAGAAAEARNQLRRGRALAAVVELAQDLRAWLSGRRRRDDDARRTADDDRPLRLAEADAAKLRAPLDRFVSEAGEFGRVYSGFPESSAWAAHIASLRADPAAAPGLEQATAEFEQHLKRNTKIRKTDQALLCWLAQWAASGIDVPDERLGRAYRPFPLYAHVVVDEAQDFTEVEIDTLVQLADPSMRCVTAAGDLAQSLDPLGLTAWSRSPLQVTGGGTVEFRVNYRQAGNLGRLCRSYCTDILQLPANYEPNPRNPGEMPRLMRLGRLDHEASFLVDDVARLRGEDPGATVVVICGTADHRRRLVDATAASFQEHFLEIRVSGANELSATAYVHVTSADATKGLEFDAVYVLGVDQPFEGPPSRLAQHLYVAISRPRRRLVVTWRERLPEAFERLRNWFAA